MSNDAKNPSRHSTAIYIAILLVLLLAVIGIVFKHNSPATTASLKGTDTGEGAGIFVPSELKVNADKSTNIKFFSQADAANQKATKTTVVLTSSPLAYTGASSISKFKHMLSNKNSSEYKKFAAMVTGFILNNSATGPSELNLSGAGRNNLTLEQPLVFANSNISSGAWEIDYSLNRPNGTKTAKVDGKFIYVIGDTAYYRLLVSSIDDNWQANQKTWHKITDSLQINR